MLLSYDLGEYSFDLGAFFPMSIFDRITEVRVRRPQLILQEAERRKRRSDLATDGRLVLLAADHPARMLTAVGENPIAMGDRYQYLGRVLRIMTVPGLDGIIATTDVIEDLLIVQALIREAGGPTFLDQKVLLGSMNRSGLAGSAWETDDRVTSFTADSLEDLGMDGAKAVVRICLEEPELTNRTLSYCADAISQCNERGLPVFVEPVPVTKASGHLRLKRTVVDIVKVMGVASALGDSSRGLWLEVPYCEGFDRVARSTTLPLVVVAGGSGDDPSPMLTQFSDAIRARSNVRGALVGRSVLFPGDDDPMSLALAVNMVVRGGADLEMAIDRLMASRNQNFDAITRWLSR
jgi:DhnA family fructose-bisphosphate aldolase class Ia